MSKLIKRQDVIELIKNSHYDLANSEDDMWSMVADAEKLPVIETEGNGLKSDFEVIDALIVGLSDELDKISESHRKAVVILDKLNFQYGLLKKEHKKSVDAVPIRHGHYVGEGDGYANGELVYDVWKCSECGCVFEDEYEKPAYNYCPNCGADMRGDNSENE